MATIIKAMTQYTVYLTQMIQDHVNGNELTDMFNFFRASDAKRFIKKHMDIYKSSSITKVWANGEWENLGEIKLNGNNRHFVTNARMTMENY